jgi:hypothetical protein
MMEYAHKLHPLPIRNWRFHTIAKPSYNMKETKRESHLFSQRYSEHIHICILIFRIEKLCIVVYLRAPISLSCILLLLSQKHK